MSLGMTALVLWPSAPAPALRGSLTAMKSGLRSNTPDLQDVSNTGAPSHGKPNQAPMHACSPFALKTVVIAQAVVGSAASGDGRRWYIMVELRHGDIRSHRRQRNTFLRCSQPCVSGMVVGTININATTPTARHTCSTNTSRSSGVKPL